MNYLIPLKKLKSLVNPFENSINGLIITKEDIVLALDKQISDQKINDDKNKFINEVAFKVVNYAQEEIKIVLPESSDIIFNSTDILKEGFAHLAAAIYREEETIIANIVGNEKIAKALLGVDLSQPDNIAVSNKEKLKLLNWDTEIEIITKIQKEEHDFISKTKELKKSKNELKKSFLNTIPLEHWNNKEFIISMVETDSDILGLLDPEIVLDNYFINIVANNTHIENFKDIFALYLKKPFVLEVKEKLNTEKEVLKNLLPKHLKDNITLEDLEYYKISDWGDRIISKELFENAKNYIQNNIFNNIEIGVRLIQYMDSYNDYYDFLSEEVKFDTSILQIIMETRKSEKHAYSSNIESFISKEKGQDINWLRTFLQDYGQYIHYDDMLQNPNTFINWYENKEKIKELLSTPLPNEVYQLLKVIPQNIINDIEIIEHTIENCPLIYKYLTEDNKKNFLKRFIENIDFIPSDIDIPIDHIYELKDKSYLLRLLDLSNTDWLANPKCPKELCEDIDLVFHENVSFHNLLENKKIIKMVIKNDVYIIKGLEQTPDLYKLLPYEKQLNIDFALMTVVPSSNDKKVFHPHLLNSKIFCLEAIQKDQEIISQISPILWNDENFLIEICRLMDSKTNIARKIQTEGSSKLSALFKTYDIEDKYEEFITAYISQTNLNDKVKNKAANTKKKKV